VRVVVVSPVYNNAGTLAELVARTRAALAGHEVGVRLVVDASPDDSAAVAATLDARVTVLDRNVGQHRALAQGLADEPDADAWVCLDADLQDPPEAVPLLLAGLGPHAVVFAGRRGAYESRGRLLTGALHRRAVRALSGLPPDAGAFFAVDRRGRDAVVRAVHEQRGPSVVAALAGLPATSVPVTRDERAVGESAWTARARVAQSVRTLRYLATRRR
jgi:polyisoprenyl-phosphate glycosyltransferase